MLTIQHLRRFEKKFRVRLKAKREERRRQVVNQGYEARYDDLFYEGLGILNALGGESGPEINLGNSSSVKMEKPVKQVQSVKPVKVEKEENTFSLREKLILNEEIKLLAAPVDSEEGKETTSLSVKPEPEPTNRPADRLPEHPGARLVLWVACDICKKKLPFKTARQQHWWIGPPPVRKKSKIRHKVTFRCPEHTPAIWLEEEEKSKKSTDSLPKEIGPVTACTPGKLSILENNIKKERLRQ